MSPNEEEEDTSNGRDRSVASAGEALTVDPITVWTPIVDPSTIVAVEKVVTVLELLVTTTQIVRTEVLVMCTVEVGSGAEVGSAATRGEYNIGNIANTHSAASRRRVMQCMIEYWFLGAWNVVCVLRRVLIVGDTRLEAR